MTRQPILYTVRAVVYAVRREFQPWHPWHTWDNVRHVASISIRNVSACQDLFSRARSITTSVRVALKPATIQQL